MDPHASQKLPTVLTGLARKLVETDRVDTHTMAGLCRDAARENKSLVAHIVESRVLTAHQVAEAAAVAFGISRLDLTDVDISNAPLDAITEDLIRKHQALPVSRHGHELTVALADPSDQQALQELRFQSGLKIVPVVAEHDVLTRIIHQRFSELNSAIAGLDEPLATSETGFAGEATQYDVGSEDNAPVVRFIDKVLLDAVRQGASDVHFEPYGKQYRVRLRQDGVLHRVAEPPAGYGTRIASRLKVMSRLDLAERRLPQDGRMKLGMAQNRTIDCRVSTCPTLHGEKIVLRLLDPATAQLGIETLGMEADQQAMFEQAIQQPHGMVLVTGPTGSGKTMSLYAGLNVLNNEHRNIATAEDPAEINLPGINQVNVRPRIGLDFATCLRAFLRQDPDIIMVGEMRDLETAQIAIKAAQTGHMVLSTVHTNNAPQTLTRLLNMGIPAYNIAASVTLIIAQRLARRLCQHCRTPDDRPRAQRLAAGFEEDEVDDLVIYTANETGCSHCTKGFRGRFGLFQVMPISDEIGRIIMQDGNSHDVGRQAQLEGVIDLYQAGLNKVRAGTVSLDEIRRVTVD